MPTVFFFEVSHQNSFLADVCRFTKKQQVVRDNGGAVTYKNILQIVLHFRI